MLCLLPFDFEYLLNFIQVFLSAAAAAVCVVVVVYFFAIFLLVLLWFKLFVTKNT